MDDKQRVALVETLTQGEDESPEQLTRFQFSNHLGSAMLELDDQAQIISYEEYYPYGSTSYQAMRSQTETPKRYRYTGKERDEESGLYYHGARYYACWLGRWLSADPLGTMRGTHVYLYTSDNPVNLRDPDGLDEASPLLFEDLVITSELSHKPTVAMEQLANRAFTVEAEYRREGKAEYAAAYNNIGKQLHETARSEHFNNYLKAAAAFYAIAFAAAVGGELAAAGGAMGVEALAGETFVQSTFGGIVQSIAASTAGGIGGALALEGSQHLLGLIGGYDQNISGEKFSASSYYNASVSGAKWGFAFGVIGRFLSPGRLKLGNSKSSTASGVIEAGPARNPVIPDEPKVIARFSNVHPEDILEAPRLVSAKTILNQPRSGRYAYVVTDRGALRIGKGQHIDLAQGEDVLAAGEVKFRSGKIEFINDQSGHFQPNGEGARIATEKAFIKAGFDVSGKYRTEYYHE